MDNLSVINDFVKLARIAELLEEENPRVAQMIDDTLKSAATELESEYPPIATPVVNYLDKVVDDIYNSKDFDSIKHNLHSKEASAKLDNLINQKLA